MFPFQPYNMGQQLNSMNISDYNPEQQRRVDLNDTSAHKTDGEGTESETGGTKSKRTRASPEQLAFLEASFSKNPSPNCKLRESIAQRIGMPERSIQVWFQNRRAKVKIAQRKAHIALREEALQQHYIASRGRVGLGDMSMMENPAFPGVASPYLNYDYNSSPLPGGSATFSPFAGSSPYFDLGNSTFSSPNPAGGYPGSFQPISNGVFPCTILSIGSWHRTAAKIEDMLCGFSLEKNQMCWVVREQGMQFRLSFPFSYIAGIELAFIDAVEAELRFILTRSPEFAFLTPAGEWIPCVDFTENQQASQVLRHVLKGEAQGLRIQVLGLLHLSQELSTVTRIVGVGASASSNSQLDARRRQSTSIVMNSQGILQETVDHAVSGFPSAPYDPQYMSNTSMDRAKNRSLSLPSLPHQQPNFNDSSLGFHPGQPSVDSSAALNDGGYRSIGFSGFDGSNMPDMQHYNPFTQEVPPSMFQTPVLPHHFESDPNFGQPFDPQAQTPPTSYAYPQASQFGAAHENMAPGSAAPPNFPPPGLAPQNHNHHTSHP